MNYEKRHQCLIYDGAPSQKLPLIAKIIKAKLEEGYRCLYLNSAPMVAGIRSTLAALDVDVESEILKARLVLSADPVSPKGKFDGDELLYKLEASLDQALDDGYVGLWASGDMTWEFEPEKDFSKLLDYELKLEQLFNRRKELCGICQYHKDSLPQDAMRQSLLVHPHVVINETVSSVNPQYLKLSWPVDSATKQTLDESIADLCRIADGTPDAGLQP